jgi:hypothetical protein
MGGTLIPILEEEGYWVDSSVTPGCAWPGSDGRRGAGPAYWNAPAQPYFLGRQDPCQPGAGWVLEVPVTIVHHRRWHGPVYRAMRFCRLGVVARRFRVEPQWLRPFPWMSAEDLLAVYRRARHEGHTVLNLMLHSSELLPKASPYYAREEDVARMLGCLSGFLKEMARREAEGITLRDLYLAYQWGPSAKAREA